ncbi:hypothetical protein [Paenibacillus sp. Soil724D2]|uniref:hypothetical protein n=1 Tax=Paenibacillus sp. (strain Soil724D2) TaxID=1736392 RepID=UPI0007127304|nr:hypothetical protein [Paenibacillus sp. Soil724D2]KRE33265.1 hypothetical protein ASG85_13370 [Paenibacillus sp. Soil724D2]
MNTPEELIKELLPKAYREKDAETVKHATEMMEQLAEIRKQMNGMEHLIGKRIKITTPTGLEFFGECLYIYKTVHVGVRYDNGKETAFNTNDGVIIEEET